MQKSCSVCGRIHNYNEHCHREYKKSTTNESKLRSTNKWRLKSLQIRERANNLCEVCRDHNVYTYEDVEVHHIEKIKDHRELLLEDTNLICLCKMHHKLADAGDLDKEYLSKLAQDREHR